MSNEIPRHVQYFFTRVQDFTLLPIRLWAVRLSHGRYECRLQVGPWVVEEKTDPDFFVVISSPDGCRPRSGSISAQPTTSKTNALILPPEAVLIPFGYKIIAGEIKPLDEMPPVSFNTRQLPVLETVITIEEQVITDQFKTAKMVAEHLLKSYLKQGRAEQDGEEKKL